MTKHKGIQIVATTPNGLAENVGVAPGDLLLKINGECVIDNLNYQFLVSQRDFTEILVKKPDGRVEKSVLGNGGDALGLQLADDEIKVCKQNCVFCFVRQMPEGFRPSLYLKDEDIRLSFLYGHFTTLSNSDATELDRIIRERLSPIHVSVHATNPSARIRLLGNPSEGNILGKIDHLIAGGIEMHTQVVIAPGYSDGEEWERTLADLWERRSDHGNGGILSLSCVPVGLTAHRQNLPQIPEIDSCYAEKWLKRWRQEARQYTINHGDPWLLLADEWFTRAGAKMPGRKFYPAAWGQIENGIGLVRRFLEHSRRFVKTDRARSFSGLRLLLLTGTSFAPYLSQTAEALNHRVDSALKVITVHNKTFGASVTVAGLLCGRDLLEAAQKYKRANKYLDAVIVPSSSTRTITANTGRMHCNPEITYQFLDDVTIDEMQSELEMPVILSGDNLVGLLSNLRRSVPT